MSFSWVDMVISLVILLSMITGLFRGFVKESIALGVWILAFWLAYHYGSLLDPWLSSYIHDKSMQTVVGFIIILFGSLIVGGIINAVIGLFMRRTGLSGPDRLLGMGFGFARGVFIIAILMVGVQMAGLPTKEYSKDSILYDKFTPLVKWLSGYVPEFIKQVQFFDKTGGAIMDIAHDA